MNTVAEKRSPEEQAAIDEARARFGRLFDLIDANGGRKPGEPPLREVAAHQARERLAEMGDPTLCDCEVPEAWMGHAEGCAQSRSGHARHEEADD